MPVACEYPDLDDWTQIQDAELRKRVQNRLSQRRHREKIRKQNGTSASNTSSRKARSETASCQPGSTTASRSASPQTPSNTSGQSGSSLNNDARILDTWTEGQTPDSIGGLDADWSELTFLDGQALDYDPLYSFPGSQTLQHPSPALPTRPPQLSVTNDAPRPCSCGAHARGWVNDPSAMHLSHYHALNGLPQLPPLTPMALVDTSSLKSLSLAQSHQSPNHCDPSDLNTRQTRSVSETAQRPKVQRTKTADSAIELPMSDLSGPERTSSTYEGSRKRSRTTSPGEPRLDPLLLESKPTSSKEDSGTASTSAEDENSILQEVSAMLSSLVRDDQTGQNKRQKRTGQDDSTVPRLEDASATGTEDGKICGSLPKIRRGTLPGGAQIIVIVMQP